MSNVPIHVLLVEDNPADVYLLQKFLVKIEKGEFELVRVEQLNEAIACLHERHFDVILLDLSLPDSQGLETVKQIRAHTHDSPIVVLTGLDDEDIAVDALREGAQDYLVKGDIRPHSLGRAIHYAIQRQQILDRLQQVNEELSRSNQDLEQFAYVVSHDLQQPLQTILGFAQLLESRYQEQLDEKAVQYLAHIIKSSKRMGELIKDLLAYSRIQLSLALDTAIDANEAVKVALSNLQGAIDQNQATIISGLLPTVAVEKVYLTQLFQNLISNSLKYRHPHETPCIQISVAEQGAYWCFGIHDNGMGIEAEDRERIFRMFQRGVTAHHSEGTGIGLAICKKIVESYGGHIWVESQLGKWSEFFFTLPKNA